eukprot:CAMPEP_0176484674 /NCGR_PEP_ID=MMETSP0200_2-20121128/4582_1 /TAXON_ID=947934 /ORGANISM="Chaetoceros sp., Strain GSL56" /LENGTH=1308 /DNA_ID=CAMNT_0017881167 /DNA_START=165 /DNA_END=4091 /DNA_ORIENTATION=+
MSTIPNPSSSINPNTHDPIWTLKKQYAPPLGKRIVLVIKLNDACIIPGGVDTLLKRDHNHKITYSTSSSFSSVVTADVPTDLMGEMNLSERTSSSMIATADNSSSSPSSSQQYATATSGRSSPFGFLNNGGGSVSTPFATRSSGGKGPSKLATLGSKLKNQLERGVTSIAVQAQKATSGDQKDIRDLLTVGAYIQNPRTGEFDICIGMTERQEMPPLSLEKNVMNYGNVEHNGSGSGTGDGGMTFRIPIVIPAPIMDEHGNAVSNNTVIQFHLWMRSGAAIFAKNRALRKYLFVGTSTLFMDQQFLSQQIHWPKFDRPVSIVLPLQSVVAPLGKMTMLAFPDTKFPSLCGIGWSLSDPRTDTAYSAIMSSPTRRILFHPPLDQNYAFPYYHGGSGTKSTLLTTERVTESTVVLPVAAAFMQLVSRASGISAAHAMNLASKLEYFHGGDTVNDPMKAMQNGHAQCQLEIIHYLRYHPHHMAGSDGMGSSSTRGNAIHVGIYLQRPDSIFENCLAKCTVPCHPYVENKAYSSFPAVSIPFYPRIVDKNDSRLLPGQMVGSVASNRSVFVGKLRIQLHEEHIGGGGGDVFSPMGPAGMAMGVPRNLEALLDIDSYLNSSEDKSVLYLNVIDLMTGSSAGSLGVTISAHTLEGMVDQFNGISGNSDRDIVEGGLISLVGMDTLMEDDKACHPQCDLNKAACEKIQSSGQTHERKFRQLATMGEFLTFDYMIRHAEMNRAAESKSFLEKSVKYISALTSPLAEGEVYLPPDQQRQPRPFRPSSSRMDQSLSGIGFNVHIQSFSMSNVTMAEPNGEVTSIPVSLFQNVTCGAPADHFRGFQYKGIEGEKPVSGGLRRLETRRTAAAEKVRSLQNQLIDAVGNFYTMHSQTMEKYPGRSVRHISPGNHHIDSLRSACISATQTLHAITWDIAVRRANVFSQALGIALSMYLAHVSDFAKLQKAAWANIWTKHGFLITFEGLLSAAGKELGMIEDAAVGISMLRMVSVVFVTSDSPLNAESATDRCVPIVDSPYLRWLRITPSGYGKDTTYLVEVCVDVNYYAQRIPPSLKNMSPVRFYPILYQMGVDIRQWGVNAGANFGKKNEPSTTDEMDEDEIGIPDNDVLIALNYEAFRKMNAYAHNVYLCEDPEDIKTSISWERAHASTQIEQSIHPMLTKLYDYIRSSAGKMEHGILDEAGFASNRLGGGSGIFCKSGKDRTAMQVTFKQAQYIHRFLNGQGNGFSESNVDAKKIFDDATIMRVHGTRLPICDKNVGQPLYAFNSLQAKFMPEPLKPPPRALAGFLKGGRVFSGGGIES